MRKFRPNSNSKAGSVRVKPTAGGDHGANRVRRHIFRIGAQPENVDMSRAGDNILFLAPKLSIKDCRARCNELKQAAYERKCAEALEEAARTGEEPVMPPPWRKLRSSSSATMQGIVTFGRDLNDKVNEILDDPDRRDVFLGDLTKMLGEHFDVEITAVAVHRDEQQPHIHFEMLTIANNGKAVKTNTTKEWLRVLQDKLHDVLQHYIPEAERGNSRIDMYDPQYRTPLELREETQADVEQLQAERSRWLVMVDDQKSEFAQVEAEVNKKREQLASAEAKLAKAQADETSTSDNVTKLQKRVETYEARLVKAEAELETKTEAFAGLLKLVSEDRLRVFKNPDPNFKNEFLPMDTEAGVAGREYMQVIGAALTDAQSEVLMTLTQTNIKNKQELERAKEAEAKAKKAEAAAKEREAEAERAKDAARRAETEAKRKSLAADAHEFDLNRREGILRIKEASIAAREKAVAAAEKMIDVMKRGFKAIASGLLGADNSKNDFTKGPKGTMQEALAEANPMRSEIAEVSEDIDVQPYWDILSEADDVLNGAGGTAPDPKKDPEPEPPSGGPSMGM